ncbi:hypothetical protein DFS34DRAFT_596768 [Phlyctochytrium arcticum]|nr:hypothetical protein DFS34DRAFT_596768 [Phlyctochytrium arcticum]
MDIWFQLVTANGEKVPGTRVTSVTVSEATNVDNLCKAVKNECPRHLGDYDALDLLVYKDKEALKKGEALDSREKVKDPKETEQQPLLIVLPERVPPTTSGKGTTRVVKLSSSLRNYRVKIVVDASIDRFHPLCSSSTVIVDKITEKQLGTVEGIDVQPFDWNSTPKDNQYSETTNWLLNAVNTPNVIPSLRVVDVKYEKQSRVFPSANTQLSGKADLMIAIDRTPVVYVKLKKPSDRKGMTKETDDNQEGLSKQVRRQAEAEAYLFLENNNNDIRKLMVLTDLQDYWEVMFFTEYEDKRLTFYNGEAGRAIALGFIRTAILLSMKQMQEDLVLKRGLPWKTSYQEAVDRYGEGPLVKRAKVVHEPPAEISQLARLHEEAGDDAEKHLLEARMQLVMRGAMWGQTSAHNVFQEAEHMLRGEYLHMYA